MRALFAYGTLMSCELRRAVLGGQETTARLAYLSDYRCYRVRGKPYPAIVAEAGTRTTGELIHPISAVQWRRLDQFEGDLYERYTVTVVLEDGTRQTADTYLIAARHRDRLDTTSWNFAEFSDKHLARYLSALGVAHTE